MCVVPLPATIWISAEDVLHFADLGFEQISVEPVVAAPEEDYAHPGGGSSGYLCRV